MDHMYHIVIKTLSHTTSYPIHYNQTCISKVFPGYLSASCCTHVKQTTSQTKQDATGFHRQALKMITPHQKKSGGHKYRKHDNPHVFIKMRYARALTSPRGTSRVDTRNSPASWSSKTSQTPSQASRRSSSLPLEPRSWTMISGQDVTTCFITVVIGRSQQRYVSPQVVDKIYPTFNSNSIGVNKRGITNLSMMYASKLKK